MSELENLVRVLLHGFPVYTDYIQSERLSYEFLANLYTKASNEELRYLLTGSFREGYPDLIRSDADFILVLNPAEEILTLESQSKTFQPVVEAPAHVKLIIPRAYSDRFKEKYYTLSTFLDLLEEDSSSQPGVQEKFTRGIFTMSLWPIKSQVHRGPLQRRLPRVRPHPPIHSLRSQRKTDVK